MKTHAHTSATTLLVNADDFGLHADIDRGILDCITGGVVQSVSFSPQGQSLDWDQLISLQKTGVKTGLHLTLVGEPWGTTGQVIPKWPMLIKWLLTGGAPARRALDAEADWQIRQCLDHGLHSDHLDSHQHVHLLPVIWPVALRLARTHRIPRVRIPRCPSWKLIKKSPPGVVLQTLAAARAGSTDHPLPCLALRHAGHNSTDILINELRILSQLRATSRAPLDTVELVMHPGHNTPALEAHYPDWKFDWTCERNALLDPRLHEAMKILGFQFAGI